MNNDSVKEFTKQIYFYAVSIARHLPYRFVANDGTIQQLKNSGAFRLIRKRSVVDSISKYDVKCEKPAWAAEPVEENLIDHYRGAATKIFDALVFNPILDENAGVIGLPAGKPALQPYSRTGTI
jgi:hypothetical protein